MSENDDQIYDRLQPARRQSLENTTEEASNANDLAQLMPNKIDAAPDLDPDSTPLPDGGMEEEEFFNPEVMPWVAFLQLTDADAVDRAAEAYFGPGSDGKTFKERWGIDLMEFRYHYLEVDQVPAPVGPVTKGPVRPIVVIRETEHGHRPMVMHFKSGGFYNARINMAWIKVEDWEQHLE